MLQKLNEILNRVKPYLSETTTYDYHSTQIDIHEKSGILGTIFRLQMQINDNDLYTKPDDDSFGKEFDSHITVCYGLKNESDYFKLRRLLSNFGPVEIYFSGITKFSTESYDVIKIDIISEKLKELNSLIRNYFDVNITYPDYHPHLTIAYVKPNSCDHLLNPEPIGDGGFYDKIYWSHIDGYKLEIPLISLYASYHT